MSTTWEGPTDSDGEPCRWHNHYACKCGARWSSQWSCQCDDECPTCGADISPSKSDDLMGEEDGNETVTLTMTLTVADRLKLYHAARAKLLADQEYFGSMTRRDAIAEAASILRTDSGRINPGACVMMMLVPAHNSVPGCTIEESTTD